MALKPSKIFNTTKSKNFWLYIVLGSLFLVFSIILMPFWQDFGIKVFFAPWGYTAVKIVVAVALLLYAFLFLLKKVAKRANGAVKVLEIIEFILLILIAIACIAGQFSPIKVGTIGQILGFVLWVRGAIEVFRAYYYKDSANGAKYPVWQVFVAILLISAGTYFIVSNVLSDKAVLWAVTVLCALCSILAIVLGIIKKPIKNKK